MTRAYYNDHERSAARWLRALIAEGWIAEGDVDDRPIEAVVAADVRDYRQCHFFAGIGGWSYALRLAGWPDDRSIWSGSCPCQPFSSAGKGQGFEDGRHLWPAWRALIEECQPSVIVGEQIAAPAGLAWFDHVAADLEARAYAIAAADLPAAGVGAPHRRQRLFWVAELGDASRNRQQRWGITERPDESGTPGIQSERSDPGRRWEGPHSEAGHHLGHTSSLGLEWERPASTYVHPRQADQSDPWARAEWVRCPDGHTRAIEPGLLPVAHGVPARVGRLRGYGNAIVPQVAAAFITAYLDRDTSMARKDDLRKVVHAIDCDMDEDCTCGAGWDV